MREFVYCLRCFDVLQWRKYIYTKKGEDTQLWRSIMVEQLRRQKKGSKEDPKEDKEDPKEDPTMQQC